MKMLMRLAIVLVLCPVSWAKASDPGRWHCTAGPDAPARRQQVMERMQPRVVFEDEETASGVQKRMAIHHTPALSAVVIRNGEIDWSAAWGALETGGTKTDCSTLFQGGSLAKPATLIAALRMKQAGVIDFDRDIESMLRTYRLPPGKQSKDNPVTPRNLLRHTAGITPGGYDGYTQDAVLPTTLQILRGQQPANSSAIQVVATPNERLAYSGGGYTLMEAALQDTLHQPFERLMQHWLIKPVGMRQASFIQPMPAVNRKHAAKGHLADGRPVPGGWNNHPERAAAGLWATPSDFAQLLVELRKAHEGKSRLIARASVPEMLADPIDGHSYGFRRIGEGEDVFITHYGGTLGYRAGMTINLRTGNGAVYLTNADSGSELGVEFLNAVSATYGWPVFKTVKVKRVIQPVEMLESLVGLYDFADGPTVGVVFENGGLTLVFPNKDRYAMTAIAGAALEFIHPATAVRVTFDRTPAGVTIHLYGDEGKRRSP